VRAEKRGHHVASAAANSSSGLDTLLGAREVSLNDKDVHDMTQVRACVRACMHGTVGDAAPIDIQSFLIVASSTLKDLCEVPGVHN